MNRPKNVKASSIKSAKSSSSISTISSNSIVSHTGTPSEGRTGRPQQQRRNTPTFGAHRGGQTPGGFPPSHSEQNYQQAPLALRKQPSNSSTRTGSSDSSVYTVASENNGTALIHPVQAARNAAAAQARARSEEKRRAEDVQRQRERDASRERVERLREEAQLVHARQDPDQDWFVERAKEISDHRANDRGKRMKPQDRKFQ
ncbi:hypothetical protein F5883DRAFT_553365 [Diaporthe sp. PMI_573]|jgi:hypothetical protein|nr:hypothetical protein F5883DRAFT_553365 [Diaporthaceae sp. PMI_573]